MGFWKRLFGQDDKPNLPARPLAGQPSNSPSSVSNQPPPSGRAVSFKDKSATLDE